MDVKANYVERHNKLIKIGKLLDKLSLTDDLQKREEIERELLAIGKPMWNQSQQGTGKVNIKQLSTMYKQGYTIEQMAEHFGCKQATIQRHLRRIKEKKRVAN